MRRYPDLPLWFAVYWSALALLCLFSIAGALSGCAETRYQPGRLRPTAERMQELLNAPVVGRGKAKPAPFGLSLSSTVAFQGSAVRLSCYVPESLGPGSILLELDGHNRHASQIQHAQTILLVEHVECGTWAAVCEISTARGRQRAEQALTVKGGLCE